MKTEEREVADLRTYEQIRKETEIPKDAEKWCGSFCTLTCFHMIRSKKS